MSDNSIYGTSGNDILSGGNGKDTVYGGDGDDIISGGNGVDTLFGDAGNDQLYGDNGSDHLTGGAGDDLLDGKNGFDTAYYSGTIGEYSFLAAAGYLHVLHLGGAGPDGHDRLIRVERLVFADRVIDIGSGHNAPVAGDDHVSIDEDTGTYSSGSASVKDNDFDFDGDALTVSGGVFVGTYGTLTLNADGTYSYTLSASAQALALGQNVTDSFNYTVSDNDGSDTGTLVFHIAGVNDAPTANPDTDTTAENAAILIDVLANDTDVDNGAMLTVTAAPPPSGQGSVSVVGNQVEFDPGTDFDDLAAGESEEVVVSYDIEDEHGALSSSTITITVTGTNDGPVASPDTGSTDENTAVLIDVLANDTDADNGATLTVTAASAPVGQGSALVVSNQVEFDPGTDFDDLAVGDSEEVVVSYDIEDEHGASSSSTITITVTGTNDAPVAVADLGVTTENGTATGTSTATKVGSEFLVNTQTTSDQLFPTITGLSNGGFVVSWYTDDPTQDGGGLAVKAQLFDAGGAKVGGEFLVNTETAGDQSRMTITGLTNGGFVVSWNTFDGTQDGDGVAIKAQVFDASGAKLGGEFLVNTETASDQYVPTITGLSNGGFVVSWWTFDSTQDGSGIAVKAQIFDAGGAKLGSEFLVNTQTADHQFYPTITGLSNGGFVVSWYTDDTTQDGSGLAVKAQVFDASGAKLGGEFLVNTETANDQYLPTITGLSNGGFVVCWTTYDGTQDGDGSAIKAQIFDASGAKLGGEFLVNTQTANYQNSPTITGLTNGGFVVSWTTPDPEDGSGYAIKAQVFDASGAKLGDEFLVNTQTANDQLLSTITGLTNGGFVVSWTTYDPTQDGSGFAVKAQVFALEPATGPLTIDVLANDTDVDDGAVLTVTAASAPAGQGTASVVGNQVQFDPGTDFEHLALGDSEDVVVSYDIEDEHGATASSTITITVTGTNDGPVANSDTGSTDENTAILIDVLANDTDVDDGAVLTVTAASAPVGQGSASVVGNQVEFDPGTDFDDLALNESEEVVVSYDIEDEHGALSSSTITITVTGTNDGPVANPDTDTVSENAILVVEVLANDTDADNGAILTVIAASAPPGQGTASFSASQVEFDPGSDFDYLLAGETAVVVLTYTIEDEYGSQSSSTVTVTVEGRDAGVTTAGTEDDDVLIGTSGDDTIDGLGGSDQIIGLAGDDQLNGGDGFDYLSGDADNDVLNGGNNDDNLFGGEGNDQLFGQADNDNLSGENGDDELSGGEGNDNLDGGDGDDTLDGGDGDDSLSGGAGTNELTGGAGNDYIVADSTDAPQTIDGGDGDDTIVHYYRHSASTIVTGSGSDTIELAHADQGTAAIIVTDFTAGAGGDMFRLSGADGALLSLLSGWDGSSNPFGSGFLRLQQSGADTLFQWDQNGATGGATWETLVIFQNTDADDFTEANFVPGYDPDGSAPAGQTITGTEDDDVLVGTIGSDTIDALGGSDQIFGLAGADQINGGDGFDYLSGDADNDVLDGGNNDDNLFGGEGNDQLFGQADNDNLSGENGDDELSGGEGNDNLDGGDGDDTLDGGDGDDSLSGGAGTNELTGGAGNDYIVADSTDAPQTIDGGDGDDTIVHYYRHSASTIVTGSGSDTIELAHADQGTAAIIVTDFTAGAGGDKFRLSGADGALLSLLSGWDGSSNPFGSGFLRLQQSGADTLFQWDQNGATGGATWETLVVFQNTDAGDFTEANFVPGYDPDGSAPAGQTITGTEDDDFLVGTIGDDTIDALGGNDLVFGQAGADQINGGDGFDYLRGDADNDVLDGGNNDDNLFGGEGNDQLFGQADNDNLSGENGDDQLWGGDGDDNLDGGDGDDTLAGGDGNDYLMGGDGADVFSFQSALDGPDGIGDFTSGTDKIQVSASGFGGGLTAGGTVSLVSGADPTASGATGQFLFDTDDGRLLWDADGTGGGEAVLVATLNNIPSLATSDFAVI